MSRQLPLPLPHHVAMGSADLLPVAGNAEALAWITRWPGWPGCCLAIGGPAGSGKTHLLNIWLERSGATLLALADLLTADTGTLHKVAIDGADAVAGNSLAEERLFHLYNHLKDTGGSLLLTGALPPAQWQVQLPDLHSRLATATVATIGAPDDALLSALLVKQFHDRQLSVGDGVITFLLPRIERSPAAIAALVTELDRLALAEGRAVTVALARRVLEL